MMKRTSSFRGGQEAAKNNEEVQAKMRAEALAFGQKLLADVDLRIARGTKPIKMVTQVFQERERPQARMVSRKFSGRVWKQVFIALRHDRVGIYKDVKKVDGGDEGTGYDASKEHTVYLLSDIQTAKMEKWQHPTAGERGGLIIQFKAQQLTHEAGSEAEGETWELQLGSTEAACAVLRAIKYNMRQLALARANALKDQYSRTSSQGSAARFLERNSSKKVSAAQNASAAGGTQNRKAQLEGMLQAPSHLNDAAMPTGEQMKGGVPVTAAKTQQSPQKPAPTQSQRRGSGLVVGQGRRASLRLVKEGLHPDVATARRRLSQEGKMLAQMVALGLQGADQQPTRQASPPRPANSEAYTAEHAAATDFVMQLPSTTNMQKVRLAQMERGT
jgi:hypothetical protein